MTTVLSEARPIKSILYNLPATPRTDKEKERKGIVYKKTGLIKVSKVPLLDRSFTLIRLDRFEAEHFCALCNSENKSKRVVLIKDNFSGETFYVAKDCLWDHFGIKLDELDKASGYSRQLFERAMKILGLEAEDNLEAALGILLNFAGLISFDCAAVGEARAKLQEMIDDRGGLALGKYDGDISELDTFITLQAEHRHDPDLFEARWRALKTHPNRRDRSSEWRSVRIMADEATRVALTFEDFRNVVGALGRVRGQPVKLRNSAVNPAAFESKKNYEAALAEYYRNWADTVRSPKENYHFVNTAGYLEYLHQAIDDLPLTLAVSSYYPVKERLEVYELKNVSVLKRLTNNQAQVYVSRIVRRDMLKCPKRGKDDKIRYVDKDMYYIGVAVWRPDGWQPAYNEWRKYGREALESLSSHLK